MSDTAWNFKIVPVSLDGLDMDASQPLGMVLAQPYFRPDPNGEVPFQMGAPYVDSQIEALQRAFRIREVESRERRTPIPFVVFPEYSIPVVVRDGLDVVREQLGGATDEVVFIGGLEGVRTEDLSQLARRYPPAGSEGMPSFSRRRFVNACVVAVKDRAGKVNWHFQAKLSPSQWEEGPQMSLGDTVLYFHARGVSFVCQLCFDHIAELGTERLIDSLCDKLLEMGAARGDPVGLDFLFVPQCNPKPRAEPFAESTARFLRQEDRSFNTVLSTVVAVNAAAPRQEPGEFGYTGLHYRGKRWQAPRRAAGPVGYELTEPGAVTSAVLRKRTSAIHVIGFVPPQMNLGDSGNPRTPLDFARSYLSPFPDQPGALGLRCDVDDAFCESLRSSAGTFVECRPLPCKLRDCLLTGFPDADPRERWTAKDKAWEKTVKARYEPIRSRLLSLPPQRAGRLVGLLLLDHSDHKDNPDLWTEAREHEAVREAALVLTVLDPVGNLDFSTEDYCTAILGGKAALVVLDGGRSESRRNCLSLAGEYCAIYECMFAASGRPILIVATRSSGRVDPIVASFDPLDITRANTAGPLREMGAYVERRRVEIFLCRDDLFDLARISDSPEEFLRKNLEKVLGQEQSARPVGAGAEGSGA